MWHVGVCFYTVFKTPNEDNKVSAQYYTVEMFAFYQLCLFFREKLSLIIKKET